MSIDVRACLCQSDRTKDGPRSVRDRVGGARSMADTSTATLGARLDRRRAVGLVGTAVAAPFLIRRAHAAPTVTVGVVLPLSGANAQFGINSRNGITLVADQINAA